MPVKKLSGNSPKLPIQDIKGNEELVIKSCHPGQLIPHPRNVRIHPEENMKAIMKSLTQFGQQTPIVIWYDPSYEKHLILKGNGTHTAVTRLGWDKIQYVDASDLSPSDAEAYAIADNKTSDMSHFDNAKLSMVMKDLEKAEYDLEATGFSAFEREPLLQETRDAKGEVIPPTSDGSKSLKFTAEEILIVKDVVTYIRQIETEFDVTTDSKAICAALYRLKSQSIKWQTNVPF